MITVAALNLIPMLIGIFFLGVTSPYNPHAIAYCADVCVPREMPIMIGRLQFWLWSGLAIGAFICVGLVFATLGMGVERLVINFGVGSAFGILGMIFLCIMMPESLNKQERMGFKIKNAFPCSTFFVMSRNNFTRVMWVGFWMTAGFAIGGAEVVLATWFVLRFQLAVYFVLGGKNGLTDYLAVLFSVLALNWLMQGLGNAVMVKPYMAVFKNDFKKVFTVAGFFTFMGFFIPASFPVLGTVVPETANFSLPVGYNYVEWKQNAEFIWVVLVVIWIISHFMGGASIPTSITILMGQYPAAEKGIASGCYRAMEACGKFIGSQVMRQIMGPIIGSGSLHPCGTGWYFKSPKTKMAIKNTWPCLQDGGYKGTLFVVPLVGFLGGGYFLWLAAFFIFGKDDARLYAIAEKADDADKKAGQEM